MLSKLLRLGEGRMVKRLKGVADYVNTLSDETEKLTDEQLRAKTAEFKTRIDNGADLDDLLPEAFAVAREAAWRVLSQRHFDVQVMGGAALHFGNVAEMKTGEGKTLTCVLPAYLNGLGGKGVHVVTVNEYLAKRDAEWMGRVHRFLGLEVDVILNELNPEQRRAAYNADITYSTNWELGFDYLRDNMTHSLADLVQQRGHNFAIVDEVDSILIDEARTPLIISGPADDASHWHKEFARLAPLMEKDLHYEVDLRKRTVGIDELGVEFVEDQLGIENLYEAVNTPLVNYLNNALKAKELYKRDKDYLVREGEVVIVDEFSGRMLTGRRYNDGIHEAIEAKEGVEIKSESQTLASITLQNYYRLYKKLAGMTGTAETEAAELHEIYKLGVVSIPTNRPMVRTDQSDLIYKTQEAKFLAVADDIKERNEAGQPVLVGTTSVERSEYLSRILQKLRVPHNVLNAKNHELEAAIVAEAGRRGAVTVATNMAGRGANIKPDLTNYKKMAMAAIDAANGQNKPVVIHMKDAKEAQRLAEWLDNRASYAVADQPQDVLPGPGQVLIRAGHEGPVPDGTTLLDYHDYPTGGLYVIGTERANSRRIDDQLIGRSARQGTPGRSKFFLSLQDDLLRVFGGENLSPLLDLFGDSSKGVQSKLADKLVAQAQSRVEGMHFEVRDNTTKYDEVLNKQRDTFYAYRDSILGPAPGQEGEQADVKGLMLDYAVNSITDEVLEHLPKHRKQTPEDVKKALAEVCEKYNFPLEELNVYDKIKTSELEKQVASYVESKVQSAMGVFEDHGLKLEDGARVGMLTILDANWTDHLEMMEALKDGIQWEAIAGRKPEDAYIERGFEIFKEMITNIERSCTSQLVSELLAGADMIKKGVIKVPEVQRPAPKSGLSQSWTSGDDGKLKAEWKA
ncbi:MAG: preprotein translocase subunit SecA, partial [Mycobacterium sp.]|nr:preprotein translocase subunit SecA [Mycobacterium sp.]